MAKDTTVGADKVIRVLERQARRLLADVGALGEVYESARTEQALGYVAQAVDALRQAGIAAKAAGVRISYPARRTPTAVGQEAQGWVVKTAGQLEAEGAPIAQLAAPRLTADALAAAGERQCVTCGTKVAHTPDWTLVGCVTCEKASGQPSPKRCTACFEEHWQHEHADA